MRALRQGQCLILMVTCLLVAPLVSAEPQPATDWDRRPNADWIPPEIVALLNETRDAYWPDAVMLQVQRLHHGIHAGSILPAGVKVTGVKTHEAHRHLVFAVETGIVFNSHRVDRLGRVTLLWSGVLMPALGRPGTYEMPGDGIAAEFTYFHHPYEDSAEFEDTVRDDPGRAEQAIFCIRHSDVRAFRRRELDASQLYSRSHARIDGFPFSQALRSTAGPDQ